MLKSTPRTSLEIEPMSRRASFAPYLLVVAVLLLAGCASTAVNRPATSYEIGEFPEIGQRRVANVGDVIYTKYDYVAQKGARLTDGYEGGFLLGRVGVPAGTFLRALGVGGSVEYCTERELYYDPLTGPYDVVCFADWDRDGRFEKVRVPSLKFGNWGEVKGSPLAFREDSQTLESGFKKELLYQGISGSTVTVAYREYSDDLIRPAFQQQASYTLEAPGPTTVGFQEVRIEIYGADNQGLDYRVVQGF